jgi:hypothetical protein
MISYRFQGQPDAIEPLVDVLFLILVTTPLTMAQLLIALAGGLAAHFLSHREPVGRDRS